MWSVAAAGITYAEGIVQNIPITQAGEFYELSYCVRWDPFTGQPTPAANNVTYSVFFSNGLNAGTTIALPNCTTNCQQPALFTENIVGVGPNLTDWQQRNLCITATGVFNQLYIRPATVAKSWLNIDNVALTLVQVDAGADDDLCLGQSAQLAYFHYAQ